MQPEVAKKLYKAFDCEVGKNLPMFVLEHRGRKKGIRIYRWKPTDEVSIFLMLVLSPNSDAFTLEAAWSAKHMFPFHLYLMSPLGNPNADIPAGESVEGEFRFRVPELWAVGKDSWWHVRGDNDKRDLSLDEFAKVDWANSTLPMYSDEQIAWVVDAAISRIKSDALPFMKAGIFRMKGTEIS